jgi:hypothetical protein
MTTTLRPENEKLIAQAMQTGAYQSADEVVERAVGQFECCEFFTAEDRSCFIPCSRS